MNEVELPAPPLSHEPGITAGAVRMPSQTRVVKKLAPGQPGARKLGRIYGSALVCVRFRQDPQGRTRYTTVELVVASQPVRSVPDAIVGVRIGNEETGIQRQARAQGAEWDAEQQLWRLRRRDAVRLGWMGRIVAAKSR